MCSALADITKRLQSGSPFPLIEAVDESLYSHQYLALSIVFHFNSLMQFDFLDDQLNILSHIYYYWISVLCNVSFQDFSPLLFFCWVLCLFFQGLFIYFIYSRYMSIVGYLRFHVCFCFCVFSVCLFYFACVGSQLWHTGSSLQSVGLSQLSHEISRAHGLSSCSMQTWLSRGMWNISSLTRDPTSVLCVGRQICNHHQPSNRGTLNSDAFFTLSVFPCFIGEQTGPKEGK